VFAYLCVTFVLDFAGIEAMASSEVLERDVKVCNQNYISISFSFIRLGLTVLDPSLYLALGRGCVW